MSATDIKHVRYFDVTVTLYGDEQRDLPANDWYRNALRVGSLTFRVDTEGGKLAPEWLITATGRNVRKDGSLGATNSRLLRRDGDPWAFEYVDRAVELITSRDWPELVAA